MVCTEVFRNDGSLCNTLEMSALSVGGAELSGDTVNTMNNIQLQQAAVEFTISMYAGMDQTGEA